MDLLFDIRTSLALATSPSKYDRRPKSQETARHHVLRPYSNHCRAWFCSNKQGMITWSRRSSREYSETCVSLDVHEDSLSGQGIFLFKCLNKNLRRVDDVVRKEIR